MKKYSIFAILFIFGSVLFSQQIQLPKVSFNYEKDKTVSSLLDGKVIYAENDAKKVIKSSMNVPEELSDGIVIVEYENSYYFKNELITKKFQLLYCNIIPDSKYAKATKKHGINVKTNDALGKAKGNVYVIIRAENLDPHLVLSSKYVAYESGSFWYFDLNSMNANITKYLTFKPITSIKDVITFSDGKSESFENIVKTPESDKFVSFEPIPVKINTILDSCPVSKHQITDKEEQAIHDQYLSNMNLETIFDFNGIKVHAYFPENFAEYFKKEYKTGDSITIYGNILYVFHNELHIYGRDFALKDPEETINAKTNLFIQLNKNNKNSSNKKDSSNPENDYVDISQTIPKGGHAVYERFFTQQKFSPAVYKERNGNNSTEYFDKKGNKVASMFPYNDTGLFRVTQTYKYDSKNRIIEHCIYESYLYQENGKWTVDQKRSRLTEKQITEYKDVDDGYESITKTYHYSYSPKIEHLENETTKKFNSKGIMLSYKDVSITGKSSDTIEEYDEKGNMIYEKGFGEKNYEQKFENSYDGDQIISKKINDLISGSSTLITYEYNDKNQLICSKGEFNTLTYKYDSKNRLIEKSTFNKDGNLISKNTKRYDAKTGILIFDFDETFSPYEFKRFSYYELKKDHWETDLTPEKLLEKLPE